MAAAAVVGAAALEAAAVVGAAALVGGAAAEHALSRRLIAATAEVMMVATRVGGCGLTDGIISSSRPPDNALQRRLQRYWKRLQLVNRRLLSFGYHWQENM